MNTALHDLIGNLAMVIVFISLWSHFQYRLGAQPRRVRRLAFSIWLGLGAVASMLLAVQLRPGVFFDLRATLVVTAAFLGGAIGGLVAGIIAGLYRFALGGAGVWAGLAGVAISTLTGIGCHYLTSYKAPSRMTMVVTGVAAGISSIVGMVFLPSELRLSAFTTFAGPELVLNSVATIAAILSVVHAGKVRNEHHLLRNALTEAPDYLYVKNLESRFIAVNLGVATHHGFSAPQDMVGKSDYDLVSPERARGLFVAEQDVMRAGLPVDNLEEALTNAEGEERWFVTSKRSIKNPEGETIGLVGVTRDVTAYRHLEAELRESQALLSRALAEMSDGVAMFDKRGTLLFCNERYRMNFPLTAHARVVGASLRSILLEVIRTGEQLGAPQKDEQLWMESVLASLKTGGEEEVKLYDGRWLHVRTRPGTEGSALVVVSDATTMKSSETALLGLTEQLRTLAATDSLTGLANRRAFDLALPVEIARAARQSQKLALLMIDVDKFKSYNDIYGHPAGDNCLREVGKCLSQVIRRPGDIAARYGGEEFVLLLPDTNEDGAYFVAETFRNLLKSRAILHEGGPKGIVTASIGIATTGQWTIDANAILLQADEALYAAKSVGRDRVMGWTAARVAARR